MRPLVRVIGTTGTALPPSAAPGAKVIRSATVQACVDVQEMREAAQREATEILAAARQKAAEILAAAHATYDEEKARGYAEGLAAAEAEAAERRLELAFEITDYLETVEETVVDLVLTGVQKVLGTFDNRTLVARVVGTALAVVRDQQQVVVRVCPAETDLVREQLDGLLAAYPSIGRVDVVPDGRLPPGGCIVESERGIVEASLHVQLGNLTAALNRCLGDGKPGRRAKVRPDVSRTGPGAAGGAGPS